MIRAVFDTNVFISGLLNPNGLPAKLLELALQGKFRLIFSPPILQEVEKVLAYPKIKRILKKSKIRPNEIEDVLGKLLKVVTLSPGRLTMKAIPEDPSDNMILACALEGRADFIVSGDHHLKDLKNFQGIQIVDPAGFLKIIAKQDEP